MTEAAPVHATLQKAAALMRAGSTEQGIRLLEQLSERHPQDPAVRYHLAEALVSVQRIDPALMHLGIIVNSDARQLQPKKLLGSLYFQLGRFDEALRTFLDLISLRPRSAEFVEAVAKCHIAMGRPQQAAAAALSAREQGVTSESLELTLSQAFFSSGRLVEAHSVLKSGNWPRLGAQRAALLAQVLERQRQYDDAIEAASHAINLAPDNDVPHRVIARIDRSRHNLDAARSRLEALLLSSLAPEALGHTCMELGQVLDDLSQTDEAMQRFEQGHAAFSLHNPSLDPEMDAYIARLDRWRITAATRTPGRWPQHPPSDDLPSPVFLIGFPRSGTTLFERVLGNIPGVATTDEAPMLVETVNEMLRMARVPARSSVQITEVLDALDEDSIRSLRAAYWRLAGELLGAQPDASTLVDKHPLNTPLLPVIRRLFPDAGILTVLRDPRDVVLSAYMQDMVPSRAMLHYRSLDISARLYDAMMCLYIVDRDRLGLNLIEARYEDLIDSPDQTSRRIVEFMGAEWTPSILHANAESRARESAVNPYTTSRDLFRSSYGRWRRYAQHLAPVVNRLASHIHIFGYAE
ncbi:MAG: sulfotransferase [Phycisphaerales bacterium]